MQEFISAGFKAVVVCVNSKLLDKSFCGREIDQKFLSSLPDGIDPCGENGEFHTSSMTDLFLKNRSNSEKGML